MMSGAINPLAKKNETIGNALNSLGDGAPGGLDAQARIQSAKRVNGVTELDASLTGIHPERISHEGSAQSPSFSQMLESLVKSVDEKAKISSDAAQSVMSGESDNIHQAMIAMQEAGVAYTMLVEVRNKLTESYQQLLKMTV